MTIPVGLSENVAVRHPGLVGHLSALPTDEDVEWHLRITIHCLAEGGDAVTAEDLEDFGEIARAFRLNKFLKH